MRQGEIVVYIERAYSERSGMQVVRAIGGRAPLHLTSVGKLFLAPTTIQRVRAYATRTGWPATRATASPNCRRSSARMARVNQLGTARDDEELELGCAAWPPASATTRAIWWPACRSRHRPTGWRNPGWSA